MPPRVAVVILSWNGRALLERFLPSVRATTYPNIELVVADNASTDDTVAWLASTHPGVTVLRHPDNWLFARGNNAAVAATASEYVCLLNNDVEVAPGWLAPLVERLEAHPDVAAVQPKLLQHAVRDQFEYAGASGGFLDAVGYPFTRGRLFSTLEPDSGQYDDARDVLWASGACLLVRRTAYESLGGLDEAFGMHMEEIDFCWRLWRAGWRVQVEPESEVYHLGGASLPQGDPRKAYLNFRNSLLMLYKNTSAEAWPSVYRRRWAVDRLAQLRAFATGNRAEAEAIRRAQTDALALFPSYSAHRPGPDEAVPPPYRGLIAFDYYVRRWRRFQDLPRGRFGPRWR